MRKNGRHFLGRFLLSAEHPKEASVPPDEIFYETYGSLSNPELNWGEKLTAYFTGLIAAFILALLWTLSPFDDAVQALILTLVSGGVLAPAVPILMLVDEGLLWVVGVPVMIMAFGNRNCKRKLAVKSKEIQVIEGRRVGK